MLGDPGLRPRKRRAAPRSEKSARGCHFKLNGERAGGRARGSARQAPGSVPGLRRSSLPPPRPGRAPGPRRAPPRRASGDTAGVALRATARLGAGACALREAGGEPGAGSRSPRRSPNRGEYSPRRPQRRARGRTQGPLPSPRTPGLRALRVSAHLRRACTRTPGTAHAGRPSPAQPLHVLRTASHRAPHARPACAHTRLPPAIYTPPGRPRCTHAPHIQSAP